MKTVILAGGLGTRLSEETEVRPKPMVDVGGQPLIWHIMKHYSAYGFKEFAIALGYKGEEVKQFFLDYGAISGSITVSLKKGDVTKHTASEIDWTVDLI
ncbi:MAG: NTP transferase domain-containing protein, partial [Actinobacteria bacterium]|nr:NTP transferase domain-containing protein [Actinomycetota bacterium]